MRDPGGSDQGERDRPGRRVPYSDRPRSPARRTQRSPSTRTPSRHRHRHSRSDHDSSKNERRRSRDRSRDRSNKYPDGPASQHGPVEDLIPRFRAKKAREQDLDKEAHRSRSRERRHHHDSPSSAKRHRGRSHSADSPHRKRSKRAHDSPRRSRDYSPHAESRRHSRRESSQDRHHRHHHRRRRSTSSRRHSRSRRSPSMTRDPLARRQKDRASRSPARHTSDSSRPKLHRSSARERSRDRRKPSRSPSPADRSRRASARGHRASSRSGQSAWAASPGPINTETRPHKTDHPRSPRSYRDRRGGGNGVEPHYPSRSDKVGDDMTSRSPFRGEHNYKSHYGLDSSGHPKSPQHGGSFQHSQPTSPYPQNRPGRNGQPTPEQHHPSQFHNGSGHHGPPSGPPPDHHHSYPPRSPPHGAPSGPMNSYSSGNYRGSTRGNSQRGSSFASRGGFWGSNTRSRGPESSARNNQFASDESSGNRHQGESAAAASKDDDDGRKQEDTDAGNTARPPTRPSAENPRANEKPVVSAPSGPSRPSAASSSASSPPGASGKFSFAFKNSSKPTPTAPKPEISQKFNAPAKKGTQVKDHDNDREPPRSAPTEPASARQRMDFRNPPPDGPKMAPRMRLAKKIMQRPKPRPVLDSDLLASESVFYRKPGNESVVGSGTYGKVFKGLNVYTKGLVALKRIRMEGEKDGFPVTAVREIKLLQSLRHTNIVNLQEVMVEKNDCFMVFEYLSHDLTGLLNHPTFKLEAAQRKDLARQLFVGLDYLHVRGVLHRDIKAANILVSSMGVLKLADFGLARFYAKRHQLDYTNRVITIWYRSPELLLGETQYTAAVDVWSAACVMVEIFNRTAIFPGEGTEPSQLDKIYNVLGTPSRQDWPGLVDMAWFELLRPTVKRRSTLAEKYSDKLTPAAFELLSAMFQYDPSRRPTAAQVLQHAYFTKEEPLPRQAIELAEIDGDWHEFESKALRKENERREREAQKAATKVTPQDKDTKRAPGDGKDGEPDEKRVQVEARREA